MQADIKKEKDVEITSARNERIKAIEKLFRRRERDRRGLFVVEGLREIEHALRGGVEIQEVFVCPSVSERQENEHIVSLLAQARIPLVKVSRSVFSKIAYREDSGGLIAIARAAPKGLSSMPVTNCPLYLVAERVEKPGNLGAIFRSADGAGATGVIIAEPATDIYNPNAIRASLGTIFTVPVALARASDAMRWLKKNRIRIVATSPRAELLYTDADLAQPTAIIVGSEDRGLGKIWMESCDLGVRIPMMGRSDSLNVSAAATILLYEALRQRVRSGIIECGREKEKR